MAPTLRVLEDLSALRDPLLIAGFAGANGGGSAAATVQYLSDQWDAQAVAEIDPDEYFDFTVRRPIVHTVEGERVVEWPVNRVYVATRSGAARDLVLLPGIEPHMQWRHFSAALMECLGALGVRSVVLLGSQSGAVPHTRPLPLRLTTNDPATAATFAVQPADTDYEGLIDFATAFEEQLRQGGAGVTTLTVLTPFYVAAEPNANAMLALIHAVDGALGTSTLVSRVEEAAVELNSETEEAVESAPAMKAAVQSLEQQYDWIRGTSVSKGAAKAPVAASALPAGSDVLAQVERLLREHRPRDEGRTPTS